MDGSSIAISEELPMGLPLSNCQNLILITMLHGLTRSSQLAKQMTINSSNYRIMIPSTPKNLRAIALVDASELTTPSDLARSVTREMMLIRLVPHQLLVPIMGLP